MRHAAVTVSEDGPPDEEADPSGEPGRPEPGTPHPQPVDPLDPLKRDTEEEGLPGVDPVVRPVPPG